MPKYDEDWHKQDMADEFAEYEESKGIINVWSELSDIAYTYTRARWSGHNNVEFQLSKLKLLLGIIYMIPKYSLRWRFFRKLGQHFDKNLQISEVRNPKKIEKLKTIAEKYNLDSEQFKLKAEQMIKYRMLLK